MSTPWQLALGNDTPTTVVTAAGRIDMANPTFLDIGGGTLGQMLRTDGNKGLTWATPPGASGGIPDAPSDNLIYSRQNAGWVSISGSLGGGAYLPLTGGTLTGNLVIAPAAGLAQLNLIKPASGQSASVNGQIAAGGANRWAILLGDTAAESGGNVGSNFTIGRFTDAGAFVDFPLTISRSSGTVTVTTALSVFPAAGNSSTINLQKPASGLQAALVGFMLGNRRWQLVLGDSTAEGGSNAGSDFVLTRFSDANANLGNPLSINRATGVVTLSSPLPIASGGTSGATAAAALTALGAVAKAGDTMTGSLTITTPAFGGITINPTTGNAFISMSKVAGTAVAIIQGLSGASRRWAMVLGDGTAESGGNVGSDFYIQRFDDTNVLLSSPITVIRSTGNINLGNKLFTLGPTAGAAGLNLPHGVAPTTPANGDLWTTTAGVFAQVNGASIGPFGAGGGGGLPLTGGTLTGALTISMASPALTFTKPAAGTAATISSGTGANNRWMITLGDNTAETGGNIGSNFQIARYNDAGVVIDNPIVIQRGSGGVTFGSGPTIAPATNAATLSLRKPAATQVCQIDGSNGASSRWAIQLGNATNETGGNVGSDFAIARWSDTAVFLDYCVTISRATAAATFTGKVIPPASAAAGASLNLPHGAAPTSPVNGDMWTTTAGLYVRINGATVGPLT